MIYPYDFADPLTLHLLPSSGSDLKKIRKIPDELK